MQAEGGVGDVAQLDALLRALGFSQAKADDQVGSLLLSKVLNGLFRLILHSLVGRIGESFSQARNLLGVLHGLCVGKCIGSV